MIAIYHTVLIHLTQDKFTIIDFDDYDRVTKHRWHLATHRTKHKLYHYVQGSIDGKYISLHRFINKTPKSFVTDHWNGNTLDNRRDNLRTATHRQNLINRGKTSVNKGNYKGVESVPGCRRWRAAIRCDGKRVTLGWFDNEVDAALAYNFAAIEAFGEFAALNRIEDADISCPPLPAPRQKIHSKFLGVTRHGRGWQGRISTGAKTTSLGIFDTELDAAKAYNEAAKGRRGLNARLNNIEDAQ